MNALAVEWHGVQLGRMPYSFLGEKLRSGSVFKSQIGCLCLEVEDVMFPVGHAYKETSSSIITNTDFLVFLIEMLKLNNRTKEYPELEGTHKDH